MSNKPPRIGIPGLNRGAGVPAGYVVGRRRGAKQGPAELLDLNQLQGQGVGTMAHTNRKSSSTESTALSSTTSLSTSVSTALSSTNSTNVTQSTSLSQISNSLSTTNSTNVTQSTSLSQISSSLSGAISTNTGQSTSLSQVSSSLSGAISSTSSLSTAVSTVISGSISAANSRIDSLSAAGGGGGATTFLALTDTPASYAGAAAKVVRVNAGETALEFNALSTGGFETLDVDYTDGGNTTTSETDLFTYTLVAGKLGANGDRVETQWSGTFVSSGTATRQLRAYFGGTLIFDSGALTVSLAAAWDVYCTITRVSATVIRYAISMTTEGAALAAYTASGEVTGLTLSNTNIVKITGTAAGVGAATNDIVGKMGNVSFYPLTGGAINDNSGLSTSLSQVSSSLSGAISSTTSLSSAVGTVDSNQSTSISANLSKINSLSTAVGGGSSPPPPLEQHTASSSASLDFAASITATYDEYLIELVNIIPATDATVLRMRMSTNAGVSYDATGNYSWQLARTNRFGQTNSGADSAATQIECSASTDNGSTAGISGTLRLFSPASTALHKAVQGTAMQLNSDGTTVENLQVAGFYRSTTAVDAFQFLMSSGNIASGIIRVYGIAK